MAEQPDDSSDAWVQFAKSTSKLHKILECPVCQEVAKTPVRTCSKGHITCSSCAAKMTSKKCTQCKRSFLQSSPRCLNNLLRAVPHFCRYAEVGCKEVAAPGNSHELYCGFRTFTCREFDCGDEVEVRNAVKHNTELGHNLWTVEGKNGEFCWIKSKMEEAKVWNQSVSWDGQFGYVSFDNSSVDSYTFQKNLKIKYEVFPVSKVKSNVYLRLQFEKDKFVFTKIIKPTIMKGESDVKCENEEDNIEEFCMKVPQIYLSKFLDSDGDLILKYEYFES